MFLSFSSVVEYARRYTFDLHFPQLYVEGQYALEGQVLFIPVRGQGKFTGNFSKATLRNGIDIII